jgi:hypothetical protein
LDVATTHIENLSIEDQRTKGRSPLASDLESDRMTSGPARTIAALTAENAALKARLNRYYVAMVDVLVEMDYMREDSAAWMVPGGMKAIGCTGWLEMMRFSESDMMTDTSSLRRRNRASIRKIWVSFSMSVMKT